MDLEGNVMSIGQAAEVVKHVVGQLPIGTTGQRTKALRDRLLATEQALKLLLRVGSRNLIKLQIPLIRNRRLDGHHACREALREVLIESALQIAKTSDAGVCEFLQTSDARRRD